MSLRHASQNLARPRCIAACILFASAAFALDVNQQIQESGPIFTYLLDTGTPSTAPLAPAQLAEKAGWEMVAEGDTAHVFSGDCVILNDRIALVLRKQGNGAEVCTFGPAGATQRIQLVPRDAAGKTAAGPLALKILESSPGASEVQATWGGAFTAAFRINTGQIQLQIDPGTDLDAVQVLGQTDYLVVPDFFADDLVYTPADASNASLGLPAENFFLHCAAGGDLIVTCVWERSGRNARILFDKQDAAGRLLGSEIECVAGKKIWVALAEHADSWRAVPLQAAAAAPQKLNWQPPFDAKWRGNLAGSNLSRSWSFLEDPATNERVCWLDGAQGMLQLPDNLRTTATGSLLVYPVDRTQSTPLDMFLLVDIMRSTLGVGPCQYILDLEGLDAQSTPTPALVTEWIEQQLAKKKNRQDPEKMKARLAAMIKHVEEVEKRIAAYADTAATLKNQTTDAGAVQSQVEAVLAEMTTAINELAPARRSAEDAAALAAQIETLFGLDTWKEGFAPLHAQLVSIGNAEDRTLAKCRMSLRRIKQLCLTAEKTKTPLYKGIEKALGETS